MEPSIADSETPEQDYPAVNAAFAYVLPSYQFLLGRFEAADTRLTMLLTLGSSLTLGAPILAKSMYPGIAFTSPFFLLAMGLFVVGVVAGLIGRVKGTLQLPNPRILYERSLHYSDWEFKKNAVYFAGLAFDANADAIRVKGNWTFIVTGAWLLEAVCLITWMVLA